MNKTDQYRDAMRAEEMGIDPDIIMLQPIEEYAESHGDEVDTFDEDKLAIANILDELEELSYKIEDLTSELEELNNVIASDAEIAQLDFQIAECTREIEDCDRSIENMQRDIKTSRNWAMKVEWEQEIRDEEKEIYNHMQRRNGLVQEKENHPLFQKRDLLAKEIALLTAKREKLLAEKVELEEEFNAKYGYKRS